MKEFNVSKIHHKRILGRNVYKNGDENLALFWGGSALEVNIKAREIWVCISTTYVNLEQWIAVEVNGAPLSRFMLNKEKTWYCLARNLNPEKENLISIIKDTQPLNEDSTHSLIIHAVGIDETGEFCPVKPRALTMEFIGDSLTAGEGLAGGADEMDWISLWMRASQTYAVRLAKKMNADWHTMGKSGWGLCWSWDNNRNCRMPPHYEKICSVLPDPLSKSLGAHETWDFNGGKGSDYVIIALGTNDESGMNFNGAQPTQSQKDEIVAEVQNFLKLVRSHNPTAKIIWIWGLLKLHLVPDLIQKGVDKYKVQTSDQNVYTLEMESIDELEKLPEEKGSRGHPGAKTHEAAAKRIFDFIGSIK